VPLPPLLLFLVEALALSESGSHRSSAFLLSLLLPGLGQIYTGRLLAGVFWFVLTAIGYVCFIIPGIILHICCAISAGMTNPYK
jgi:hypothetical protein